jgi:hypothetical protein
MRFAQVFVTMLSAAAICQAGTITDVFNQNQSQCSYSTSAPYGTCDVIGSKLNYDIQSASLTVGANGFTTITLYTNYGGVSGSTLGTIQDAGVTLIPGDLFFYDPADSQSIANFLTNYQGSISSDLLYAVPLVSHDGLTAGDLYQVSSSQVETAAAALVNPNAYYRPLLPVDVTGGTFLSNGTVSVTSTGGNGTSAAQYAITLTFATPTSSAFTNWVNSGQIGILWSSADCGNDYIQGDISTGVPEPSSFLLMLSGVALVAISSVARQSAAKLRK